MPGPKRAIAEQRGLRPRGTPGGAPEVVRVWLLGGLRVSVGSRSIEEEEWHLRKARSLLKLLALAPGHRLHREQAMELLWPGLDPEAAANNLHHTLHVARRVLEPVAPASAASDYLHLWGERLALCPGGPLWVDVEAFEEAAAAARHTLDPVAYQAAIDLYLGELLPEDRYEAWLEERRAELRGLYLALLMELAGLYEERKEFEPAIEALGRVVAEEPTHEGAHLGLMRLYALSRRRREALRQYERLREALFGEFGVEPAAAAARLQEEIWAGTFPAADSLLPAGFAPKEPPSLARAARHNLPLARTSFVGRERETLEVKRLLATTRLLTLTGVGGCGKTRLALKVARDLVGAYPAGAWLVDLASLSEPELVPQAVARALGVREQPNRTLVETLEDALRARKMLLVVDNCEHLIEAVVHLVDALLDCCPGLRVLATSRETLNAAGEVNWVVPSLSVPDSRHPSTAEELEGYESVRLFIERAQQRDPSFVLTPRNIPVVAQICRRLDGIPLAIELATARMGVLAVEQLAERLEDSLKLLTGGNRTVKPRHRTLRATLDWSHNLLTEAERASFRRLSVFAGVWTLEAAEEVCSGAGISQDDVLDLLSRLVDKSLVVAEASSPGAGAARRYRMLEPIRQYAREKLETAARMAAGPEETKWVRERHARHYLALAQWAEPELLGARSLPWLERLGFERDNLRAALAWALDADEESGERAEIGLRLAAALGRFWDAQGPGEGRRWLERGLARGGAAPPSVRAKALNEAGFIAVYEGDPEAMALLEEGLALYTELKDRSGMASSMSHLGHAAIHLGQPERMMSLREEAQALLSEPLERQVAAHLLVFLGFAAGSEGDFEQMKARLEEGLALFRALGDVRSVAMCLPGIGMVVLAEGDSERAATLFEEGLLLQRELKHKTAIFYGLMGMLGVAGVRGHPARVAKLMGASEALREEIGLSVTPLADARYDYAGYLATARAGLGETAFDAAWAEGRAMTPEEAIEYALSKGEQREPPVLVAVAEQQPPADERTGGLTRREREVAVRVARGLTNRRIALELSISERTVENHVRKILKKLGFSSRARIAAWVAVAIAVLSGVG
ncbi:MAG: LuxR C-terminal-related transcriptional regulator [Roseiflexaceae bacterium]